MNRLCFNQTTKSVQPICSKISDDKKLSTQVKKVLVVDDNLLIRAAHTDMLKQLGYQVGTAEKGETAIDKFQDYDAVLLDIGLPDISGLDVAKRIRSLESENQRRPIIIISTHLDTVRNKCLKAGCDEFVSKPITPAQLEMLLKKWLGDTTNQT